MNDEEWLNKVFFGEIVGCYMLADLKKIEGNYDSSCQCGNCNFPLALQILSCMDFLGWLISKPINKEKDSSNNIKSFYTLLFTRPRIDQIQKIPKFADIFRNGLAHEYFAKGSAISRKGKELLSLDLQREAIVLDADVLLDEFRSSIERLKEKLKQDINLRKIIRTRYEEKQSNNSFVKKGIIHVSQGQGITIRSTSLELPRYPADASSATIAPR